MTGAPVADATIGLERVFHALSDPTRLELLTTLARGEKCVCDLVDKLDAAQSRLSFHLKVLREAGLVADRRCGRWVYYQVLPEALEAAAAHCAALVEAARREPSTCCS